ncbi:MAG: MBL fold metallo-hydrolase [Deltaproteobacteria bacterium]|nr:MBL fold metallo-hydrolase [Deltaproteobacteria bacterium]
MVKQTGTAHGIDFLGFRLPHDAEGGRVRGMVTGLRFALDGVTVFHPGDLGRPLTEDEAAAIRPVDVLLLPTGGTFTVDAAGAVAVMRALAPAIAIPMHHAHPRVQLPLAPLADFLALVPRHERVGAGPLVLDPHLLPPPTTVLVMDPTH